MTLLVGALFGFLVAAIATPVLSESMALGATGESADAHRYMLRRLDDPATMILLKVPQDFARRMGTDVVGDVRTDVATRALKVQAFATAKVLLQAKPLSFTYLGGATEGRLQVQIYAVEFQFDTPEGEKTDMEGFVLTLANSRVILLE